MSQSTIARLATRTSSAAFVGLLGAALAGCGSDGSPADDFIGTWRYTDAKSTLVCGTSEPLDQPPATHKVFARGVSSALVDLSPSPLGLDDKVVCDFGFDVAGPVATAEVPQTCAIDPVDNVTIDTDPQTMKGNWTFSLTSATTAEEDAHATLLIPPSTAGGTPTSCAWSLVGHLERVSKD